MYLIYVPKYPSSRSRPISNDACIIHARQPTASSPRSARVSAFAVHHHSMRRYTFHPLRRSSKSPGCVPSTGRRTREPNSFSKARLMLEFRSFLSYDIKCPTSIRSFIHLISMRWSSALHPVLSEYSPSPQKKQLHTYRHHRGGGGSTPGLIRYLKAKISENTLFGC